MSISTIEYALMAGASYFDTRADVNRVPFPESSGWGLVENLNHRSGTDGFEARAFIKGSEIVISYAGTDSSDYLGDIRSDLALGAGLPSDQLFQAVKYY